MASPKIRIFADLASQPSRAIIAFCKFNKIPHEIKMTRIFKGDNRADQFLKINPNGKVPAIQDLRPQMNNFVLYQSHAILRYLVKTFPGVVDEHWYPTNDPKRTALIDQYLDWHHSGTRKGGELVFLTQFFPQIVGDEKAKQLVTPRMKKWQASLYEKSLTVMEESWLGNQERLKQAEEKRQFNWIAGVSEKPTIADLSAACELVQQSFVEGKIESICSEYKYIGRWLEKIMSFQEMKQTHEFFNQAALKFKKKKKQAEIKPKL